MNHEEVLQSEAVERYVLGEMSDEEASALEIHVFDCNDCSKELEFTTSFADNARVALGIRPAEARREPARRRGWVPWPLRWNLVLPYAAAALFGGIAIYQGAVVVPESRRASEPRALNPSILRVVRSEAPVVRIDPGAASFLLVVDLTQPDAFPRYGVEFRSVTGERTAMLEAIAPPSGTLHLHLPADRFPDGDYDMVLEGRGAPGAKTGEVIETVRFHVLR